MIAAVVVGSLSVAALTHMRPSDPFVRTGVVTGFSTLSSETGTDIYATVYVDRRTAAVRIDPHHNCVVGGHIKLRKVHFAVGEVFIPQGSDCAPPPVKR